MAAPHHGGSVELVVHGRAAEKLDVEGGAAAACALHVFGEEGADGGSFEFAVEIREHAEYAGLAHGGVDGGIEGGHSGEVYGGDVYGFGAGSGFHDPARIGGVGAEGKTGCWTLGDESIKIKNYLMNGGGVPGERGGLKGAFGGIMGGFYVLLGLYAAAGTGVSLAVMRRGRGQRGYFVADGALGWVVAAMTYSATTFSAFMMVGLLGWSYRHGIGTLIFELVYLVSAVLLLSLLGPRIWDLARRHDLVSPMELLALRYGRWTARLGAAAAAAALVPYTSAQVMGLAIVMEGFGVTYPTGVAAASFIIAVWALIGGLRGVALTDAIQGAVMLGAAVAALVWTAGRYEGVTVSRFPNAFWSPRTFINITLPWAFFALTNPQVVQRIFVLRERRDLRRMVVLFAGFGLLYTLIVTFIGFSARFGTEQGLLPLIEDRDGVIAVLLGRMGRVLSLVVALSIVFAAVSTSNSILLTLSSMVSRDLVRRDPGVRAGRGALVALTLVIAVFALRRPGTILELSVASSRLLLVFVPLMLGVLFAPGAGKFAGLLTLGAGFPAALVLGRLVPGYSSGLTLAAVTVLFFAGLFFDRRDAGGAGGMAGFS